MILVIRDSTNSDQSKRTDHTFVSILWACILRAQGCEGRSYSSSYTWYSLSILKFILPMLGWLSTTRSTDERGVLHSFKSEVGEGTLLGPELVDQTTDMIRITRKEQASCDLDSKARSHPDLPDFFPIDARVCAVAYWTASAGKAKRRAWDIRISMLRRIYARLHT